MIGLRRIATIGAACAALAAGGTASAAITTLTPGTLTVCSYPGFAPFTSLSASGAWIGWDPTFIRGFAAQQGLSVTPVLQPQFIGLWVLPGRNRCGVAASGIADLAARRAASPGTTWTVPYYEVLRSFAVRKGSTLTGPQDLAGRTVIVTKGSTAELDLVQQIRQHDVPGVTIRYTDDEEVGAALVQHGDAFAYGGGLGSVQWLARNFRDIKVAWPHHRLLPNGTTGSEPFSYPVRTASTGVVQALNAYIARNRSRYGK